MIISNYEDAAHRDARLRKCLRIWLAIMGMTNDQADQLIHSLHDHKGALHVLWLHGPTERQKAAFSDAWEECCEYVVHHSTDLGQQPYAKG